MWLRLTEHAPQSGNRPNPAVTFGHLRASTPKQWARKGPFQIQLVVLPPAAIPGRALSDFIESKEKCVFGARI